ncbi:MAG TPA: hypothetical protein VGB36_14010 [Gammaproteobacteria bacterium]
MEKMGVSSIAGLVHATLAGKAIG